MDENIYMGHSDFYGDPTEYDPYNPDTGLSPDKDFLVQPSGSESEFEPEFYEEMVPRKLENTRNIIYEVCRRSGLSPEVSSKMAKTLMAPIIASMIAGSTSLVFLSGFLGISAFSGLALFRINELKRRELNQNPSKKKSIEAKYKKVLNQTYKPPKKK